jgi:hypothetical protein
MSKLYAGQPIIVQCDCKTDVSAGSPLLQIQFKCPNGITVLTKPATLVVGLLQIIECTLTGAETTLGGVGTWLVQPLIGSVSPWRGATDKLLFNANFT